MGWMVPPSVRVWPHHKQCHPWLGNGENNVSDPGLTPPQGLRMPLPLLAEEAGGHVVGGHTLSNSKPKIIPQSD